MEPLAANIPVSSAVSAHTAALTLSLVGPAAATLEVMEADDEKDECRANDEHERNRAGVALGFADGEGRVACQETEAYLG